MDYMMDYMKQVAKHLMCIDGLYDGIYETSSKALDVYLQLPNMQNIDELFNFMC